MAALTVPAHGMHGSVTDGAAVDGVTAWTLDITNDVAEYFAVDSAGDYKERLGGWSGWTATVDVVDAEDKSSFIGTTYNLALVASDGTNTNTYTGSAILVGISITSNINEVLTQTLSYQGTAGIAKS